VKKPTTLPPEQVLPLVGTAGLLGMVLYNPTLRESIVRHHDMLPGYYCVAAYHPGVSARHLKREQGWCHVLVRCTKTGKLMRRDHPMVVDWCRKEIASGGLTACYKIEEVLVQPYFVNEPDSARIERWH
jgi:hypothetical protein